MDAAPADLGKGTVATFANRDPIVIEAERQGVRGQTRRLVAVRDLNVMSGDIPLPTELPGDDDGGRLSSTGIRWKI
jgi:hypothetical protein